MMKGYSFSLTKLAVCPRNPLMEVRTLVSEPVVCKAVLCEAVVGEAVVSEAAVSGAAAC